MPKIVTSKIATSSNSLHTISEVPSDRNSIIFQVSGSIGPLCRKDRYYEGISKALCPIKSDTIQFRAFDHGAYPWGRDSSKGALVTICFSLGITTKSGVFNCCLFVHLLVGLLEHELVTVDELLSDHSQILEKYLSSIITREDSKVVDDVLVSLGLQDKISVRFVAFAFDGFLLSLQVFGNQSCPTLFIAHKSGHFFLAKSFLPSVSLERKVAKISSPILKPKTGYCAEDFGPPRDHFDELDFDEPVYPEDILELPEGF